MQGPRSTPSGVRRDHSISPGSIVHSASESSSSTLVSTGTRRQMKTPAGLPDLGGGDAVGEALDELVQAGVVLDEAAAT